MKEFIAKEKLEGKFCLVVKLLDPRPKENALIRGVTTRSGKHIPDTQPCDVKDPDRTEHPLVQTPVGKKHPVWFIQKGIRGICTHTRF